MFRRLVHFLATLALKHDLDELESSVDKLKADAEETNRRFQVWQQETQARIGAAYQQGHANGEMIGQMQAMNAVWAAVSDRNGTEVTAADIERARKGLIH